MFLSTTGLPHLLPSTAYHDARWFQSEQTQLLHQSWHLVGLKSDLSDHGRFITIDLLGHPIQIRNFNGQLIALSNVCAHRHSLISSQACGKSESMQCQYHGWQYGSDGLTRKIPCAKDFAPIDRDALRLPLYCLETCGELVFIRLSKEGPMLNEWLGPILEKLEQGFGVDGKPYLRMSVEFDANWKVAIENSLEAYHVEAVHPNTFGCSPGEERSEHRLDEGHTAFGTDMPFAAHSRLDSIFQRSEGWVIARLGKEPNRKYWQHHLFPNLLCSFTDAISLIHCVIPTSRNRARSVIFQFGYLPQRGNPIQKLLGNLWGKLEAVVTRRILQEDLQMYPRIQLGLEASPHRGCLARSEERIHRFQEYLVQKIPQD